MTATNTATQSAKNLSSPMFQSGFVVTTGSTQPDTAPYGCEGRIVAGPFACEDEARDAIERLRQNSESRLYIDYLPTNEERTRWLAAGLEEDADVATWRVVQGPNEVSVGPLFTTEQEARNFGATIKSQHTDLRLRQSQRFFNPSRALDMLNRDTLLAQLGT